MLAIGRALMTNPWLLLLDDATEGLAPVICQAIERALVELKNDGYGILIRRQKSGYARSPRRSALYHRKRPYRLVR
jgi:ABC-type branched-subunit amino acid transport system ATPase component